MAEGGSGGKDGKKGVSGGNNNALLKKQAKEDKKITSKWEKDKEKNPKE